MIKSLYIPLIMNFYMLLNYFRYLHLPQIDKYLFIEIE